MTAEKEKTEAIIGNKRLLYIDALRGFAILLVIIGHIPQYILYNGYEEAMKYSPYLPFVSSFHIPLFMMVSGYVVNLNKPKTINKLKLLIPFFIFGILYAFTFESSISGFFLSPYKYGYWYLLVLVFFFFFLYLVRISKINLYIGMIVVQIMLSLFVHYLSPTLNNLLSLNPCIGLWPYFCFGIILRHSNIVYSKYRKAICTAGVCLFIIGYYTEHQQHIPGLHWIISGSASIALLLAFFYLEQFVQNERIRKVANTIGVHTLQIYTLHYFVMSTIGLLWNAEILINKHLTWVEWVISPVLALMIAYICIYLTRILKFIRLDFVFGR